MNGSNVIQFFRFLFDRFWDFLGSFVVMNGLSLKILLISFLFFAVAWGFVFRKIIKTGE